MNNKIPPPIVALICGLGIYLSRSLFPAYNHPSIGITSALFFVAWDNDFDRSVFVI